MNTDRIVALEARWHVVRPWLIRLAWAFCLTLAIFLLISEWMSHGARLVALDTYAAATLLAPLAWPGAALIIAIILRTPLSRFLASFANRINKLSLLQVEITLAEIGATTVTNEPSMNDVREAEAARFMNDSSQELFATFVSEPSANALMIDLGTGKEWLTSRLYIYTNLLRRFKGLRHVVFTSSKRGVRRFVGIASVEEIERALSVHYPWLEAAVAHACAEDAERRRSSHERGCDITAGHVEALVGGMLDPLQKTQPASPGSEWVQLRTDLWERASWLNRLDAITLLGRDFSRSIARDGSRDLLQDVVSGSGDLVAITIGKELERIVDRRAAVELIASRWASSSRTPSAA